MSWIERIVESLAPLSIEQHDAKVMIAEWFYTGNAYDLEQPIEHCQLCGHPDIRYQFEIENEHTSNDLLVGSECIKRFRISAIDESGSRLSERASREKVDRDRSKLIQDAKQRRVVNALVALSIADEEFEIESFIKYYRERGAFTPNQLKTMIWRLKQHCIDFRPSDFKMILKRQREQDQLRRMEGWQVAQLWPCMSASQRSSYARRYGDPTT
ncbi:hypothetical protein [Roseiconus lacunae]|uniref:hypothetical protein n=1 Tax=Roseiconus lacunae TaxID=2605694 RepID=UPI0011F2EA44|nr:hypothetical protein [Roseiconus lacunae]